MRLVSLLIATAMMSAGGCHYYQDYRMKKSTADVNEQRAANMRAYRECMQRNERRPNAAETCGAYTQPPPPPPPY